MQNSQNISIASGKTLTIIGLIAALLLPILLLSLTLMGRVSSLGFELGCWAIAIGLILYSLVVEKLPMASLGFRALTVRRVWWGIVLAVVLFVLFLLSNALVKLLGLGDSMETLKVIAGLPTFSLLMLALRAAVTEEVIYRAYPMERLLALTGNKALAAGIPLLFFVLSHLSWGVGHLLFVTLAGGLFTLVYLRKRNIWINIIGHFTIDFSVLMLVPVLA